MKRVLKYLMIATTLAAVLVCLVAVAWLFGTKAGAHRLINMVSRQTGLKISAEKIEGNLTSTLRLENTDIQWPQGKIKIQYAALSASPFALFAGRLGIKNLSLKNVSISDQSPDTPPKLIWPRVSGLIALMSGNIERLEINHITYRHLDKQPLHVQTLVASVSFRQARLSVSHLQMVSNAGVARGNILAGFNRPLLEADLTAVPSRRLAGMESFRLGAKFGPGKNNRELAGNLHLEGFQNKQPLWDLSADTGMTSGGFPLKNIRLHRPGKPGLITAEGMLTVNGPAPSLDLQASATEIDLSSDFKIPTNLSGTLTFAGGLKQYRGHIVLTNKGKGWHAIRMAGDYSGNDKNMALNAIQGTALGGALGGALHIDWQNGLAVKGVLTGRNLNPKSIDPGWAGIINFDLEGKVSVSQQKAISGEVACMLRQSRLHGQQLTGDLRATFADNDIRIQHMALLGKGFQLNARGSVQNKLNVTARISDLSRLVPKTTGKMTAEGFLLWHNGRPGGVISAKTSGLTAGGLAIAQAELTAAMADQEKSPLSMNATFHKLRYRGFAADTLTVQANGTTSRHTLTAAARRNRYEMHLVLSGAYLQGIWQGKVLRLDGMDSVGPWNLIQQACLSITSNSLSLDPLRFAGRGPETLELSAKLTGKPLTGSLALTWNELNPSRAGAWMNQERVTGKSSGNIRLNLLPRNQIALTGKLSLSGTLLSQGQSITIRQSELTLKADEQGARAGLNMSLVQGGTLQGTFSSSSPARLALPDEGALSLRWQGFDLASFSAWAPGRAILKGQMAGEARGRLLPNRRFSLTGHTALNPSRMTWQGQKGDVSIDLQGASLDWIWQEEALTGEITATMTDYGKLQGRFRFPFAARLPVAVNTGGSLQASLTGKLLEKGALGVLFPGLIRESRGNLDLDLKMSGSWAQPQMFGTVHLSKAEGYLPAAGIAIKDAQMTVRLDRNAVYIDSFRAVSGPGYIEGAALIRMKGMQIESYEGRVSGERFQTIYFPELQVQSSPRLTFTGTTRKISVRGEVLLPELQIIGSQSQGPVASSPDVIREGKAKPAAKKLPINLDVQVRMILGNSVGFKASGIDAQLDGQIDLQFQDPAKITGRGEIRVVKGRYRTYGVNLDIVRGRLFYAGGPMNQPALDILAWRKVGDVYAGVAISGHLPNPLVKLYSEPFMQDTDILAYIVLGRPLDATSEQASLLATAAGALLTSRQSETLLSQLKSRLGLSTFDISTDVVAPNGQMGYKRINVAPTGTSATTPAGSVSETMLVVGKYLTPQLYISYGRSLFSGGNLFFLRYDVSKNWQVETQTGQQSGVDIYYKLEFN